MVSPGTCLSEKHHEQVPEPTSGPDVAETRLCPPVWRNFFNLITHCCAELCNTCLVKTFPNRNSSRPTELPSIHSEAPLSTQVFAQCVTVPNPCLHIVFDLISIQSENKQTPRYPRHPSRVLCVYSADLFSLLYNTLLELYWIVIKWENWIKKKIRFLFYLEISNKVFRSSF